MFLSRLMGRASSFGHPRLADGPGQLLRASSSWPIGRGEMRLTFANGPRRLYFLFFAQCSGVKDYSELFKNESAAKCFGCQNNAYCVRKVRYITIFAEISAIRSATHFAAQNLERAGDWSDWSNWSGWSDWSDWSDWSNLGFSGFQRFLLRCMRKVAPEAVTFSG